MYNSIIVYTDNNLEIEGSSLQNMRGKLSYQLFNTTPVNV